MPPRTDLPVSFLRHRVAGHVNHPEPVARAVPDLHVPDYLLDLFMLLSIVSILSGMQPFTRPTIMTTATINAQGPIAAATNTSSSAFLQNLLIHSHHVAAGCSPDIGHADRVASIQQPVTTCFHVRLGNPDGRNPRRR